MLGVFVLACLPMLHCAEIGNHQMGVVKNMGQISAGKSAGTKEQPSNKDLLAAVNELTTKVDKLAESESHVGTSSAEKLNSNPPGNAVSIAVSSSVEVNKVSTTGDSSAEVNEDASKTSAVSSSEEVNADASKASAKKSTSVEVVVNPASSPSSESSVKFEHNHPEYPYEEPNIVGKISHARSDKANDAGSSNVQLCFLAFAMCAMIAWLYIYECKNGRYSYLTNQPQWQHDAEFKMNFEKKFNKPNGTAMRMHTMLEPMVQDATEAIGFVAPAKSSYQKAADVYKQDDDDLLKVPGPLE